MAAQLILTILLDGLMAMLLVITTVYCWRLNKRIRILQDSKSELAQIIRQFDESTQRATSSIAEIHGATARIAENIQHKIDKANYLADDLQFMIEKGSKIADKMEGGLTGRNAPRPAAPAPAPAKSSASVAAIRDVQRAEPQSHSEKAAPAPARRQEARITGRSDMRSDLKEKQAAVVSGGDKARASLEGMLKRVSGRNADKAEAEEAGNEPRRRVPGARLRSRAEQELFDALKAGGNKA
jgi:hypothetical protein